MINLKETLLGGKPIQAGTLQLFVGLHMILAGVLLLKLTHQDYWWAVTALGAALGARGGIAVSRSGDQKAP